MNKTLDDWKSFGRMMLGGFMIVVALWMLGTSVWTGAGCNKNTVQYAERP